MPNTLTPELAAQRWRACLYQIGALYDYHTAKNICAQNGATTPPPHVAYGGVHSDGFVHLSILGEHPDLMAQACKDMAQVHAHECAASPEYVIGMGITAQQVAHCTAMALGCRMTYTEARNGGHIMYSHFEKEGVPVVLVRGTIHNLDDVLQSARVVREVAGAEVLTPILCIVNRVKETHASVGHSLKVPIRALVPVGYSEWRREECPLCAVGSTPVPDARRNWGIFRNAMRGIL